MPRSLERVVTATDGRRCNSARQSLALPQCLRRAVKLHPVLKFWFPVIAWMIFIFIGSTDLMSAEHTSRFIGPFLRWFAPHISDPTIGSIQLVVRKCGHLTEYAILAALLCRALQQPLGPSLPAAVLGFGISALYAALDEFHQSFVASRTGTPWDVLIDCVGAVAGLLIYRLATRSKIENRKPKI
ncbi:MAG: VanZ family protein [Chthoniobacterales bacterium]